MKTKKLLISILLLSILPLASCDYFPFGQSSSTEGSSIISSISEESSSEDSPSSNQSSSSSVSSSLSSSSSQQSSSSSRSSSSQSQSSSSQQSQTGDSGFSSITEFTAPVEIHTAAQKAYLSYQGEYETIPEANYPNGSTNISDSNPVQVSWNYVVPSGKTVSSYSIVCGKNADLSDGYEVSSGNTKSVSFNNPYLGKNYFKLVAKFSDNSKEESSIRSFDVDTTYPRNLTIGAMTNCRDVGGRVLEDGGVIKQGLVYRTCGNKYDYSTNINEAGKKEMLQHLKIKTEVNVSNDNSYNLQPQMTSLVLKNYYMDYDTAGTNSLNHFTRNAESVKNFFELLANMDNYPIAYHCRIGTDRTGLCSILLGGLLGVSLNDIYKDYLFSNFGKIGEKRYIGSKAGQDNIQVYISFINSLAGTTFKNKVYNCLLAIGLSTETLNAVISNLTEGTLAQNNNAGQICAAADKLTATGVTIKTDSTDRDHPGKYFTLSSSSQSVSYTFAATKNYIGQIVAYLGKNDSSTSEKIGSAISCKLDGSAITIKDQTYHNAGMGFCGSRTNYFPVLLGEINLSAGSRTITIQGTSKSMDIGGIYIFEKN